MANVWMTWISIKEEPKESEKILTELGKKIKEDIDCGYNLENNNRLFIQTRWEYHTVEDTLADFSTNYPDYTCKVDSSGDVEDENGQLPDEKYHVKNGKGLKLS